MSLYLVFDIGGTKTRIALSEDGNTFAEPVIFDTPKDFDDGMARIASEVGRIKGDRQIIAAAGCASGPLDRAKERFVNSPHLPGWIGKPLAKKLSEVIGAPVYLENDSAIVGLGEAVAGAGKGYPIVAYITVSTGVGGVRIVNGVIDVSTAGFEPGHQIIDAGKGLMRADEPPFPGITLESYISGTSVETRYHKKPYEITDADFWDRMARLLAYGLNNTIVHWSPDVVVIGGSMMKKIGIPVDRVRKHLEGILHIYPQLPVIVKAELGDIGGLYGALHYARSKNS